MPTKTINQPRYARIDKALFERLIVRSAKNKRKYIAQMELYIERGLAQDEAAEQAASPETPAQAPSAAAQ